MKCSSCKSEVGVLSPEWLAQRELKIKKCPSCGSEVEPVFGGAAFAKWFVATAAGIAAITFLISRSVPLAVIGGLVFGMFVALFPSFELRARPSPNSGASRPLNRTIDLPPWLKPPAWLVNCASAAWSAGSYLFLLIAVTLAVPFPWSAVLLVVLGAIGLIRSTSPDKERHVVATGSKIGAIGMLVLGIGLVVHHYA